MKKVDQYVQKIFRFNELSVNIQNEMVSEYIDAVMKDRKLLISFAKEYFIKQGDIYNKEGNLEYY